MKNHSRSARAATCVLPVALAFLLNASGLCAAAYTHRATTAAGGSVAGAGPYRADGSVGEVGSAYSQAGVYTLAGGSIPAVRTPTGAPADSEPSDEDEAPDVELPEGVLEWVIRPNQTLPAGATNRFNPNNPHVVMFSDTAPRRDQLVVFLPGSGGVPRTFERFLGHAASLGFHAIGLAYPSAGSIASVCALDSDQDCFQQAREDIVYSNPAQPEVDEFNSIMNRLEFLLRHLDAVQPTNGWSQFLLPAGGIDWSRIVVGGHSQGAGHASLIAKQNECARVFLFSGADWWALYCRPARWSWLPSLTPLERWFGFTHYLDPGEFVSGSQQMPAWEALGLAQQGDVVNVDTELPPYRFTHTLISTLPPPEGVSAHNFPVNDPITPLDADGRPLYAPAWTHLLTGPELPPPASNLAADSVRDFSDTQGLNGWQYGYWDRTANTNYTFTPLPQFTRMRHDAPAWMVQPAVLAAPPVPFNAMSACESNRLNHVLTSIWDTGCELNMRDPATGAALEQWPVRRWVSDVTGPVRIAGNLAMFDTGAGPVPGDGVEGMIRVDGVQIWSGTVAFDDPVGIRFVVETNLTAGQFVDFILGPGGADGEHDAARFTVQIFDDCGASTAESEAEELRLSLMPSEDGSGILSFEARRGRSYQVQAVPSLTPARSGGKAGPGAGAAATEELAVHPGSAWRAASSRDLPITRTRKQQSVPVPLPFVRPEVNDEVLLALQGSDPTAGFFRLLSQEPRTDVPPSEPGRHELTFVHGCVLRRYLLFVPSNYDPAVATPLVFVFHGGGQTAGNFAGMHPDLIAEADAAGMILVLPQATVFTHPAPGGGTVSETRWFGEDPKPGQTDYVDDVGFVLALIDHLQTGLNIDIKRIYAAGFSNGAKFCHYLAGRTSGVFAAFAPVCGFIGTAPPIPGAVLEFVPPPAEPRPILIVNGRQDPLVPYNGGAASSGAVRSSVAEAVQHWLTANGCALPGVRTTSGSAPSMVITDTYATCDPGTEVILHSVQNMPHIWPDSGDMHNGAPVNFDANVEVIAFFRKHARP